MGRLLLREASLRTFQREPASQRNCCCDSRNERISVSWSMGRPRLRRQTIAFHLEVYRSYRLADSYPERPIRAQEKRSFRQANTIPNAMKHRERLLRQRCLHLLDSADHASRSWAFRHLESAQTSMSASRGDYLNCFAVETECSVSGAACLLGYCPQSQGREPVDTVSTMRGS